MPGTGRLAWTSTWATRVLPQARAAGRRTSNPPACDMGDFHKLVITLDGQPLYCRSLTLRLDAKSLTTAFVELDAITVEYEGMAEVLGKILPEDQPVSSGA